MPPDNMAVNMRRTKLKAEEAALLAGELTKPSWESRNEGIHERVSFEDAIWGFDLAGGSYYKTPLRVVAVKPESRAQKAGIRPGDRLKRINDIDTSTLTIQEAHQIIIDSGIHLKIAVTAPEDDEDAYYCYEDPIEDGYDSDEERRKEEEKERKRHVHAKVSSYWSLQWPWVSKRRIIYRESNCFMVPSKYEDKHKDRFSPQPLIRTEKDIVLDSIKNEMEAKNNVNENTKTGILGNVDNKALTNEISNKTDDISANGNAKLNGDFNKIPEIKEELINDIHENELNSLQEDITEEISQNEEIMESEKEHSQNDMSVEESIEESSEMIDSNVDDSEAFDTKSKDIETDHEEAENSQIDDKVLDEILNTEEENIIDSILSDQDEKNSHSEER